MYNVVTLVCSVQELEYTAPQNGLRFGGTRRCQPLSGRWASCCMTWCVGTFHSKETKKSYKLKSSSGPAFLKVRGSSGKYAAMLLSCLPCWHHTLLGQREMDGGGGGHPAVFTPSLLCLHPCLRRHFLRCLPCYASLCPLRYPLYLHLPFQNVKI